MLKLYYLYISKEIFNIFPNTYIYLITYIEKQMLQMVKCVWST